MDKDLKAHILCVCTGNICRSPMAEKLLAHALDAEEGPLRNLSVISAGVAAYPGDPASPHAVTALKKVGLSLADHQSRPVNPELIEKAALILCMTESHRLTIISQFEEVTAPILLMRELLDSGNPEVPDPFGSSLKHYENSRDSMVEAIPSIIQFLKEHIS